MARPSAAGSTSRRRVSLSARSSDRVEAKIGSPGRPSCTPRLSCVFASKAADQLYKAIVEGVADRPSRSGNQATIGSPASGSGSEQDRTTEEGPQDLSASVLASESGALMTEVSGETSRG
jgi:hypothetical protein